MARSDKGQRRTRYDTTLRRLASTIRRLEGLRQAAASSRGERAQVRREGRPRSERRLTARLGRLPPDRRCPGCGAVKEDHRRWYLPREESKRCCLACHRTIREPEGE